MLGPTRKQRGAREDIIYEWDKIESEFVSAFFEGSSAAAVALSLHNSTLDMVVLLLVLSECYADILLI